MARTRTQKAVSHRIDLGYFKRPHPLRTGRKVFAFLFALVAIAAVSFLSVRGDARLHNPGHLTAAHASFEHDCAKCHDNGGAGGFAKAVADANCLQCHAGAIHHPNQPDSTVASFQGQLMSKDCVSCHTEHRGMEALISTSDATCTSCHADLDAHSKVPAPHGRVATAFDVGHHPRFGRELARPGTDKVVDPTVLKYNHAAHNKQPALANNCTACHSTTPLATAAEPAPGVAPPYRTARAMAITRDSPRAAMLPISYERNCIGCHALTLPGKVAVTIPHEELAQLRPYIAGIAQAYGSALNALPDKSKELTTEVRTGRPPRVKVEKVTLTEQQWSEARIKDLQDAADRNFGSDATYAAIKKASPTSQPASVPNNAQVEQFITYGLASSCNLCHTVEGSLTPATRPAAYTLPRTVPTGITTTPRKWYVNARFDHDAHRATACLDCHAAATTSTLTSDFLSPDIDTATHGVSCLSCHKAPEHTWSGGDIRGAPSNCITCHDFHDRSSERPGPTSRPMASAMP